MKTMIESRSRFHAKATAILIIAALIAGVVGCGIPDTMYSLTVTSTAGGVVTAPGEDTFEYNAGTVVNLEAAADVGYRFVAWTGDVGTITKADAASTTITMNGDHSVTASFVAVYDLTISSTAGGSVTTPGEGTFSYDAGKVANLVASPASGYRFVEWTGAVGTVGDPKAAETTININDDYSITANFEEEVPVVFGCLNLEAAIREAIGKPTGDIYPPELEGLTSLSAYERNVVSLTGLEHCSGLTHLGLGRNQIGDISPLEGLTSLTELDLLGNQIGDISPLEGLTNLASLDLRSNQISDISALAGLTKLTNLHLGWNQISDISALAGLTKLTDLNLWSNQIADISPVRGLADLLSLTLMHNQISDISPLEDLIRLAWLSLDGNSISDIAPLEGLANLTRLYLRANQISDIKPLVDNLGLGLGEAVDVCLYGNPLSEQSVNEYIPALDARGVNVYYEARWGLNSLQQWFVLRGYDIDAVNDQLGIERFVPGHVQVTILDTAGWHGYDNPTGWYTSKEQAFMLFPGRPAAGDTATFDASEDFGLFIDSDEGRFRSETELNRDGFKHALVYHNTRGPGYIIAFEDLWGGGDRDYTDRIVEVIISSSSTTSGE